MSCACRVHVVCMSCACRVHVVCMSCACRVHVVCMSCACRADLNTVRFMLDVLPIINGRLNLCGQNMPECVTSFSFPGNGA